MELAIRFDLRFIIMADRWDRETFTERSVEDLKERYYNIVERLEGGHGGGALFLRFLIKSRFREK